MGVEWRWHLSFAHVRAKSFAAALSDPKMTRIGWRFTGERHFISSSYCLDISTNIMKLCSFNAFHHVHWAHLPPNLATPRAHNHSPAFKYVCTSTQSAIIVKAQCCPSRNYPRCPHAYKVVLKPRSGLAGP
jgi:hypothetical protein